MILQTYDHSRYLEIYERCKRVNYSRNERARHYSRIKPDPLNENGKNTSHKLCYNYGNDHSYRYDSRNGNGHVIDEGDNVVWNNIALGQEPNTNTYAVGEGAGSKTIKLSRSKSSTNVFITKFVITRTADGIEEIEMVVPTENTIYNLQGQKIDASSIEALPAGLYIINGKKMVVK